MATFTMKGLFQGTSDLRDLTQHKGGFPVMAETTRNHIFSKEISQVIIAAIENIVCE